MAQVVVRIGSQRHEDGWLARRLFHAELTAALGLAPSVGSMELPILSRLVRALERRASPGVTRRCMSCRRPVSAGDRAVEMHGAVWHSACSTYRIRRLAATGGPRRKISYNT